VLRRVDDNAYEIHLPSMYGGSTTFNVSNLSSFIEVEASRMTPFQEQEDDEEIPDNVPDHGPAKPTQTPNTPIQGPITWSHANKLQQEVNPVITKIDYNAIENFILPKFSTYVLLRFTHKGATAGTMETC
jgi:hypothetical protein